MTEKITYYINTDCINCGLCVKVCPEHCIDVYKKPAVVTDTHLIRISNRIGLVNTKDPKKVEFELKKILPPDESNDFCHRVVLHGREVCTARRAMCDKCCLSEFCKKKI